MSRRRAVSLTPRGYTLRLRCIDKFLTRFRFTSLTPPVYAFHFRFGGLRFMLLGISDIDAETDAPD